MRLTVITKTKTFEAESYNIIGGTYEFWNGTKDIKVPFKNIIVIRHNK